MEIITSAQNSRVAEARKLQQKKYREATGLFLAEGLRLGEEALRAAEIEEAYYHETLGDTARGEALIKGLGAKAGRLFQVSARVLDTLAETRAPQGVVLVCRRQPAALAAFQPAGGVVVALDGIQDPGNLGTIIRTVWAAGGRGVIGLAGTADAWSGKCVRAAMGGTFHVPVFQDVAWPEAADWAARQGYTAVAAAAGGGRDFRSLDWPARTLLCIGSEARGFLSVPLETVAERVFVPLAAGAESLNAAVAAGILLYAASAGTVVGQ